MFCCHFWLSGCPGWQEAESTSGRCSLYPPDAERRHRWAEIDGQIHHSCTYCKKISRVQVKQVGCAICCGSVLSVCKRQDIRIAASGSQWSFSNRSTIFHIGQVYLNLRIIYNNCNIWFIYTNAAFFLNLVSFITAIGKIAKSLGKIIVNFHHIDDKNLTLLLSLLQKCVFQEM